MTITLHFIIIYSYTDHKVKLSYADKLEIVVQVRVRVFMCMYVMCTCI